jgi:hypothetical protein
MIVVLLILHGLRAVALLGAITHQALAVLSTAPATNGRWTFISRFRGVDAMAYATPIVVLFAITTLGGALLYPQYPARRCGPTQVQTRRRSAPGNARR